MSDLVSVENEIKRLMYEMDKIRRSEEREADSQEASERQAALENMQKSVEALRSLKADLSIPQ